MNDEEAFQAALDANPEDHTCRLVFADWLEERDDPRAEGYRALGVNERLPVLKSDLIPPWCYFSFRAYQSPPESAACIPTEWHETLCEHNCEHNGNHSRFATRREAEDAAALAFAKLTPERRAELLAGEK